jgi:hypothetical protein
MRSLLSALAVSASAAALVPATAGASSAAVVSTTLYAQTKGSPGTALVWRGDPGERNALTYGRDERGMFLRDGAGPIRAGRGCRGWPDGAVTCGGSVMRLDAGDEDDSIVMSLGAEERLTISSISLGDGDDALELSGEGPISTLPEDPYSGDAISGGDGDDVVRIGAPVGNSIDGDDGDDLLVSSVGRNHPLAGTGGVGFRGGDGDDTIDGGGGNDEFDGGDGEDRITGGDGDDTLTGGRGDDVIDAGAGADELSGDPGADQLAGGDGDDVLAGDADGPMGVDSRTGRADRLDGGAGIDLVDYSERRTPLLIDLAAGFGGAFGEGDALSGIENATGGLAADVVRGDDGSNALSGGEPADTWIFGFWPGLIANPGRHGDIVEGRGGDDRISGATAGGTRRWLSGRNVAGDPGRIDCGEGADAALPHRLDEVAPECETIAADFYRVGNLQASDPRTLSLTVARATAPPVRTCSVSVAATGTGPRQLVLAQQRVRLPAGAPAAAVTLTAGRALPARVRLVLRGLPCRKTRRPAPRGFSFVAAVGRRQE